MSRESRLGTRSLEDFQHKADEIIRLIDSTPAEEIKRRLLDGERVWQRMGDGDASFSCTFILFDRKLPIGYIHETEGSFVYAYDPDDPREPISIGANVHLGDAFFRLEEFSDKRFAGQPQIT